MKRFIIALLLCAVALSFVSCNESSEPASTTASPSDTSAVPSDTTVKPAADTTSVPSDTTQIPSDTTTTEPASTTVPVTEVTTVPAVKYTVTFETNGGTSVSPVTAEAGTQIQAPAAPLKNGFAFVGWCNDAALKNAVTFPYTLSGNVTFYAAWNESVGIAQYVKALFDTKDQDPYLYIPEALTPGYAANNVTAASVTYDFSKPVSVSSIKYGGFGEQWHMVIDNIEQSQLFYNVLNTGDSILSASVSAFNNWFDKNPSSENKEIDETGYYAKIEYKSGTLYYTLRYKTGYSYPLIGNIIPEINVEYNVAKSTKTVRISLTDTNACKYIITDNSYTFAIKYGIDGVSRNAYCEMTRAADGTVEGHIYEYINTVGLDAIKSCADFYIGKDYTSVVGNKASGMLLASNYITELYKTNEGKLLGYKIMETNLVTFNTLWFNLSDVSGINKIQATKKGGISADNENPHNVFVNGSSEPFAPTYNKILTKETSRKYDIEMRTQYFYGIEDGKVKEYKCEIPMMFIQDGNNFNDYKKDIKAKSGITSEVTLKSDYLTKIRADYEKLIPIFKDNKKDNYTSDFILNFIG